MLWVDSGAGATAGILVLLLHSWLVELHQLPASWVWLIGAANLGYACYSGSLALRASTARRVPRVAVDGLILANFTWTFVCAGMLLGHWSRVSSWGIAHLLGEGAFVAALAALELRVVRPETTALR